MGVSRRKTVRKTWQETWAVLRGKGIATPKSEEDGSPVYSDRPRAGQDDFRGLAVCDRVLEEMDLENLTLVKALFSGCRFHGVSLRDTDLTLSRLYGCQFVDCDLTGAWLIRADLTDCGFFACNFTRANLIGADLLGATFEHVDFTDANLLGAAFDRAQKRKLRLTAEQRDRMADWRQEGDEGPDTD
jgi:uncharacterized protein YjbI with pentapeptide repeats